MILIVVKYYTCTNNKCYSLKATAVKVVYYKIQCSEMGSGTVFQMFIMLIIIIVIMIIVSASAKSWDG